jgi:8-oxo-dGTP pyrophosphatase MutT (NUDIX family)
MNERDLRNLLAQVGFPASRPQARGDHDLNPHVKPVASRGLLRPAAVLVPIILRQSDLHVLFTRRADHLARHAGQVSFPGGRLNSDVETALDAALRETEEEIGLGRNHVEVLAELDAYETGTGFRIQPFVGLVREGFQLHVDAEEVAEVFEVPLDFLLDRRNHETHSGVWQGAERRYYAIPFGRHYIWGATAGIVVNMHDCLRR